MRPYCTLLLLIAVVFLGGALLAPWLYWLAQWLAPASALARKPFHRYVDRALLGLGLIAIWPLLWLVEAESWRDAGLCSPSGQWGRLAGGWMLGLGSVAALAAVAVATGTRRFSWERDAGKLAARSSRLLGAAFVIAVLEEILFRGAIFGALRQAGSWPAALLFSSLFYACMHFLSRPDPPRPVKWCSGLESLPGMLKNFKDLRAVPRFLNLTLAGIILGLAYQRTGNLYFSIGLHAAWVFCLKLYDIVTVPQTRLDQGVPAK
jgi:membrane protease YdiL (CAAX protease family)